MNKFVVPTISFCLGALTIYTGFRTGWIPLARSLEPTKTEPKTLTQPEPDEVIYPPGHFGQAPGGVAEQMKNQMQNQIRQMRNKMLDEVIHDGGHSNVSNMLNQWFQSHTTENTDVTVREDKNFLYYDISIKGAEHGKLDVKVENGNITISKAGQGIKSHQSFPIPPNADGSRAEIEKANKKIILKFPKEK